jgi:predicted RNase H-like HicB family nuclease
MIELVEDTSHAIVMMEFVPPERRADIVGLPAETTITRADPGHEIPEDRFPHQLIRQYVKSAVRRAATEQMSDGRWYAEIALLPGVWADGDTEAEALAELESVTEGWLLLKIEDHDRDIPVLETLDLNRL